MSFVLLLGQDVAEDVEAPLSPLGVVFIFLAALWEGNGGEGGGGRGRERRGGREKKREEGRAGGKEGKGEFLGKLRSTYILITDLFLLS